VSEPRPGYLLSQRATIVALSGVLLGMLLAALNQTIVGTALPRITEDLGGLAHYSWVFSAYMLVSTVTVPVYGRLSDIYGRRPFFAIGIVVFMAGAVVAGTADSRTQLIVARAIQGLGAGALIPLAMAVIGDLIPPSDRGRWQGLTGAVFGSPPSSARCRAAGSPTTPTGAGCSSFRFRSESWPSLWCLRRFASRRIRSGAPASTTPARACSPPACPASCSAPCSPASRRPAARAR
jgi:MFS family permease